MDITKEKLKQALDHATAKHDEHTAASMRWQGAAIQLQDLIKQTEKEEQHEKIDSAISPSG